MNMTHLRPISRVYQLLCSAASKFWKRDDAASLVIMAIVLSMLLGIAGLAIDGSNIYYQTQRMQISADAAALGGARKLAENAIHGVVDSEIRDLAFANAADDVTWSYINGGRGVHVVASRIIPAYFARIYGYNVFTATANAEAQYETVAGAGGLFPFTVNCNCDSESEGSGGGGGSSESPPLPDPDNNTSPDSGTVQLPDGENSSYAITYLGQTGTTWSYQVDEIQGRDLSYWLLNIDTCLDHVVSYTPNGAIIGTDGTSGLAGIKWNVASQFTDGTFSFTLDEVYPSGEVDALANATTTFGTVSIRGPICDGTNTGDGGGSSEAPGLCLPTLEFETDTAGAALVAGQIIDTEWAAWGVHFTTNSPTSHPAMIFNSASPTGGDTDLGTPNQAYGGPGIGSGGGPSMPGYNSAPLGKVLIVAESPNSSNPDDRANGGTIILTFDYPVRLDDVKILDIDDTNAAGTIKAYRDTAGTTLVATGKMQGFGDNSVQTVAVNGKRVQRLDIKFPKSGAVASIVSCRSASLTNYRLGNLVWNDVDHDGIQDSGEPGLAGVKLELYPRSQNTLIATVTSNVGGEYVFTNLPNGDYDVKIAPSNFQAGGALFAASYSTQDATHTSGVNDDTIDSDFNPSTGRAPAVISTLDNPTVDGGFALVDAGPQSAIINVSDNQNSTYEIELVGVSGHTWTYHVSEISGHNLDYWSLGIPNCLDKIVSYSPAGTVASGVDSSTGFNGMKWSVSNAFVDGTFSFTLDNAYQASTRQALVTSGNNSAQLSISGPDCSVIGAESPTPEPTPEPSDSNGSSDSEEICKCEGGDAGFEFGVEYTLHEPEPNAPGNFGWIRWEGDNPSTTDLANNINNPGLSPVLYIGDMVQGTTGIKNSSLVETAFEQWIGKIITIPIYNQVNGQGSNVLYRVCTFASFELTGYDRSTKTITGVFVRTLVHSDLTDNSYPDVGARDVRMIR